MVGSGRLRVPLAIVVVATIVGAGGAAGPAGLAGATFDGPAGEQAVPSQDVTSQTAADRTIIEVTVYANRSARWTLRYRTVLENDSERASFEAFAADFNANETQRFRDFRRDAQALTREGANTTGREMDATGFRKRAFVDESLDNQFGVVELSFLWTSFAEANGGRVVVGDVFEGGFYVGPDQTLVVRPGPDLAFESVTPNGTFSDPEAPRRSDSVTWEGERSFTDERPRVVFSSTATGGSTRTTDGTGPGGGPSVTPTPTDPERGGGMPAWLVVPIVGIVVVAAAVAWYRRWGTPPSDRAVSKSEPSEPPEGQPEPVPPEELLSDEDRVERLLEQEGGRMRQSAIVEETDWSKSKVSMVLSEMEEEGQVSKLRIGRENVIALPGEEPGAADSPFEDSDRDQEDSNGE